MSVLEALRPAAALRYFEELCAIPHGSRDTERISDYCVRFAERHGLRYVRDKSHNVIIYKPASPGYETHPTVILQGHLDMVCEKEAECEIDFATQGLRLRHDGRYIFAEGTTLGADDGIAVAYALAILAADDLPHPPLEAVFTTDEEIGMLGANALDMSLLKGRLLLNCDSEDEGVLTVSCAGGATACLTRPVRRQASKQQLWRVRAIGFAGGHSGVEIHKPRANATRVLAGVLRALPVRLICIDGGQKDNAIARECTALLASGAPDFAQRFAEQAALAEAQLPAQETEARLLCERAQSPLAPMTDEDSQAVLSLITALPNGVQAMSRDIPNLVQTSLNLGVTKTDERSLTLLFSVRSSVNAEKAALIESLRSIGAAHGAHYTQSGEYPAWEYRANSPLRDTMVRVFEALYGKKPVVEAIHAGLECGIFSDRLPGLDAVSFGPQMRDIHTTGERLDIASAERTWNYLIAVLAAL